MNHATGRHARILAGMLLVGALGVIEACSSSDVIGSSAQATTVTPVGSSSKYVSTSALAYQNNEPSCTWSPPSGANRFGVWVCGYNDNNNAFPGSPSSVNLMGWSFSTTGTSWTHCNPSIAACGSTPMVPTMTAWRGDPQLVADGEGDVVYVAMGDVATSDGKLVVAALSTDGGQSFTNTVQVNMPFPSAPCPPTAGGEDQPSLDFDLTTPSTSARKLSVVWRHNGGGGWGACMRRGTFCKTSTSDVACTSLSSFPNVAWETATGIDFGGQLHQDNTLYGQSGLIVQAGGGAVAVVYADCDHSMVNCPDTSVHTCGWHRALTYDGGNHWAADATIDYTTQMQNCVINGISPPNGGRLEARHRGTFAFTRNRRNGDYYVATMHGKGNLVLFRSQNQGATWAQVNAFVNGSVPTIALPVLAADSAGRLALEYLQSDPTDAVAEPVFATVVFDPTTADNSPSPPTGAWAFSVMTSGFYNPSPGNQVRAIGDYNSIAVMDPAIQAGCTAQSGFLPAWTDTLGPSPDPFNVHVVQMAVTP